MDIPLVPYISWDWEGHLAEATHGNMEILFIDGIVKRKCSHSGAN